ncbi:MAG: hopanoid biosynthesis-associated RND transporter HpnN [Gammaproteobacteria bacterium]|nr:MAG: hopanoid biosynthesis-associated RND transporter HpnN [Gammaproteobacteria bacterium]
MTNHSALLLDNFLDWWSSRILHFSWLVILLFVILSGYSLHFTINNLGVNTDTSELLSPDLPFQQNSKRWENAFPQDADTILLVVESPTAEQTAMAANKLAQRISANKQLFEYVYIPGDNAFFKQQGLLYLELDKLENLATTISDAQPFIGHLSENYHLQGLLDILGKALESSNDDLPTDLNPLLENIDQSLIAVQSNQKHYLSWKKLLSINQSTDRNTLRSIVSARPIADFNSMKPVEQALNYAREVVREIKLQDPQVSIRITGEKALEEDEMRVLAEDTVYSGLFAMVLVIIVLLIGLRSVKLVLCTLITLIMGLILTAGFATIAVGHLNVLSVAFAILYIGLGVDFAIHICLCFRECWEQHISSVDAIQRSVKVLGFSLFLCALTTSIGFFAFIPTDYKGVSELGLISGGGMFVGLFVSLSLLPALLKVASIKKLEHTQVTRLPDWIYTFPFRHAISIRYISILLAIAACFSFSYVRLDSNPVNLRDPNSESVVTFKDLLHSKTDSPFALIALSDSLNHAEILAARIEQLPTVNKTILLKSFVAKNQDDKLEIIDDLSLVLSTELDRFNRPLEQADSRQGLLDLQTKIKSAIDISTGKASPELLLKLQEHINNFIVFADASETPESVYQQLDNSILGLFPYTMQQLDSSLGAYPFALKDIPGYISKNWLSSSGIYKIVIEPKKDLNIAENLAEFAAEVKDIDNSVTGIPVSDLASGVVISKVFVQAFSTAIIVIFLVLLIILRNFRNTLLVIWPLLLAGLLTAATNVLLNNPFNFANIIALPLLMGMGVDSGIHIMHRLESGLKAGEHLLQTSTARGVFFSSLTTLLSFTSLAFTNHQGIASMGMLLAIGISFTLICTLVVLPAFSKKKIVL